VRPKLWNVKGTVEMARDGRLPPVEGDMLIESQKRLLHDLPIQFSEQMGLLNPTGALRAVMSVISETNKYVHNSAPWDLAKNGDAKVHVVIYYAAESLRLIGILLQPFMPAKAAELLDVLGVPEGNRNFKHAGVGADFDYGSPMRDPGRGALDSLFPPLEVET